jgi:hypothetical protein
MRKILDHANVTFDPKARTITFASVIPPSIDHILRVANLTRAEVYFNPTGEDGAGYMSSASYASPVLTLKLDTSTHESTDVLFIEYDDDAGGGGAAGGGGSGLTIPACDFADLSYTGGNLTGVVYKKGGAGGATVATLTLAYTADGKLNTITKV